MTDELLIREALGQAGLARQIDEVPIGCVIWHAPTARIVGTGHNTRERDQNPLNHAEILAIEQAARALGSWRLIDCTLAVTLEPCPMCAGAIVNARIPRLVYGCDDPKAGAVRTLFRLCDDARLNHRVEIVPGVLADECATMLREFFRDRRRAARDGVT
ncbi:MAG TPA: tRNA adenosine(34) deaminase TadA [Tepidisphaeraceae bacterium]|nr:tRNA adenosine(34) deaminase TadA [Tepidisphaeraceae bacterium]